MPAQRRSPGTARPAETPANLAGQRRRSLPDHCRLSPGDEAKILPANGVFQAADWPEVCSRWGRGTGGKIRELYRAARGLRRKNPCREPPCRSPCCACEPSQRTPGDAVRRAPRRACPRRSARTPGRLRRDTGEHKVLGAASGREQRRDPGGERGTRRTPARSADLGDAAGTGARCGFGDRHGRSRNDPRAAEQHHLDGRDRCGRRREGHA